MGVLNMECRILSKSLSLLAFLLFSASVLATTELSTSSVSEQISAGKQSFSYGRYEDALAAWNLALDKYRETGDKIGQARVLQYKADAYLAIGQYYKATSSLKSALNLAADAGNDRLASQIAASLGTAYMLSNRTAEAKQLLEKSVASERSAGRPAAAAVAGNNLGNLLASQGDYEAAIAVYNQAVADARKAGDNKLIAKGSVNSARAMFDGGRHDEAQQQLGKTLKEAQSLPSSHQKAYILISIGRLYSHLAGNSADNTTELYKLADDTLQQAADVAETIGDKRAMSYANGYLGELNEQAGNTKAAMEYAVKASFYLQDTPAPEIRYRWHWLEGRLLRTQGDTDLAINAYQRAVTDLQTIRPILASVDTGKHGEFRQEAGRLYLDLADLLLQKADSTTDPKAREAELREVRSAVEMLKGAELENYFRDDCVAALKAKTTGIDQLGEHTAAIYPIILPDRLEILLSLPSGIKRHTVAVSADDLNNEINRFRSRLEKRTTHQYRRHAQKLYSLIIEPLEKDLAAENIDTLVFIPDGALRTIPLTALHDGENFLVTRFAVATTPGLTLTDPQPLPRENVKLLVAGLTEGVQGFPPLPDVEGEVNKLDQLYDGAVLENATFTESNIEQSLGQTPYSIVHVASHGKFQTDVRNTFLLTYDGKLNMDTLEGFMASTTYRDRPVELLTLSACQTAVGDDQAALGLGGVAVKAGARSAVATLWYINDKASSMLITEFYSNLHNTDESKAQALQKAQIELLNDPRFSHPSYWAPFLLIGNWL